MTVLAKMSSSMSFSFCFRLMPMSSTALAMNCVEYCSVMECVVKRVRRVLLAKHIT